MSKEKSYEELKDQLEEQVAKLLEMIEMHARDLPNDEYAQERLSRQTDFLIGCRIRNDNYERYIAEHEARMLDFELGKEYQKVRVSYFREAERTEIEKNEAARDAALEVKRFFAKLGNMLEEN